MVAIDLTGKIALVTGAAGGMGAACARKFAEAGASVVLVDLQYEKTEAQAKEISADTGMRCIALKVNVTKQKEVEDVVAAAVKEFGRLDIMVNCAGIGLRKPFDQFTDDDINRAFQINQRGVWYGCVAAGKVMVPQKSGVIINFSSVASRMGGAELSIYAGTKAAVSAYTQSLGRELAPHNVRVCAVLPGHVITPMWEHELDVQTSYGTKEEKEAFFANVLKSEGVPMGRPQLPSDIANAVAFLASDLACNITAQVLSIDGGCTISF